VNEKKSGDVDGLLDTAVFRGLSDLVSGARTVVEAALAPLLPTLQVLRELMVAAEPVLRDVASRVGQAQELFEYWEQHAPTTLKDAVSARGLIVPISQMSFADLISLIASHRDNGDDAVVQRIRDLYDEIFRSTELLDGLEATWAAHPLLEHRMPLLGQALQAHKLGMFAVSVPTLIAQFEGIVADAAKHVGKMGGPALRVHVERLAAGSAVAGRMFTSFVNHALLAKFEHGSLAPPFSRHAILHGGDLDYATELNSRTAILLIDNLQDFAGT
jgi:hypothetical protein